MKRRTQRNAYLLAAAVAAALAAPGALAQSFEAVEQLPWTYRGLFPAYPAEEARPTEIWLQGSAYYDSNIFRLGDAVNTQAQIGRSDRSDFVTRVGAGIRHEARVIGRQRVRLEARGEQYSFDRSSVLDHFAYGLRGEWLWEVTNDLSGNVGYERRKRLVDLAQLQRPVRDMVTEDHAVATGAWRVGPNTRLRAGVDAVRADRTLQQSDDDDFRANSFTIGADYVTPLGNSVGIETRRIDGNAPVATVLNGPVVDNEYDERQVNLVATWAVSPQVRFAGNIGRTTREHEQFPIRNFRGTTWRVTADWQPFNKTGFTFSTYRQPRTVVDIAASYVVTRGWSVGPRWAPREKLVFSALYLQENLTFSGDPAIFAIATQPREETVRRFLVGAGWEPVRFVEASLGYEHGRRSSDAINRDFKYHAVMANLRARF